MLERPSAGPVPARFYTRCSTDEFPSEQTIEIRDVFRQLLMDEIRSGRLSPARRRRIVRYGAKLRMSAVEVGQLVQECKEEALESADPTTRVHALRLAEEDAAVARTNPNLLLMVVAAAVVIMVALARLY